MNELHQESLTKKLFGSMIQFAKNFQKLWVQSYNLLNITPTYSFFISLIILPSNIM